METEDVSVLEIRRICRAAALGSAFLINAAHPVAGISGAARAKNPGKSCSFSVEFSSLRSRLILSLLSARKRQIELIP